MRLAPVARHCSAGGWELIKQIKTHLFRLLGKDPDAVVVSFATGSEDKVRAMVQEVMRLIPERRHFLVSAEPMEAIPGVTQIALESLRPYRIGMAAVLFDGDNKHTGMRRVAFLKAPRKILAFNSNLENHHLKLSTCISSFLFLRGVPLDRIHLRPRGLQWTTHERTTVPNDAVVINGRKPRRDYRRIGVLTPFAPYPLSHGGAVRLYYMLRDMARDFDIYLFAFREKEKPEDLKPLTDFCTSITLLSKPRYREPRWASLLPAEVKEYSSAPMRDLVLRAKREQHLDLIQVEYTQLAQYSGDILVEHDVSFDLYQQLYQQRPTLSRWWNLFRWRRFETAAVQRYLRVVTMSDKDADLLNIAHARPIPNGVDLSRFRPIVEPGGQRLLFIGSFRHFPNVMAFRFLIDEVWPRVRESIPEATLTVVAGPDPHLYCQMPDAAGVTVLGFVADVRPLYEHANLVLVPTLVSAGTNVKVLEAMAMERAIVSTTSGCGGIPVVHGEHVWIADGAEAFHHAIEVLLLDGAMRRELATRSRRLVEEQFDWGKLGAMQRAMIAEILPDRIVVRDGLSGDIASVRVIQAEALAASKWEPEQYMHHEFYVATFDGQLAGFIVARKTAPDEREILNIAVAPPYRRLGIGERLLERLMYNGESGDVFLEVRESNHSARRLYERLGFADVGRRAGYYEDPVETAVIMKINTKLDQVSFQNSSASERRT